MDAGPDALQSSTSGSEPPLGAIPGGDAHLGSISPELALVDPELARHARELLPEPRPRLRAPRPAAAVAAPELPAVAEIPVRPDLPRRRWPRTAALAAVIFAAGGASGSFLGTQDAGSPENTLEVRALAPATHASRPERQAPVTHAALRPPKVSHRSRRNAVRPAAPQRRRHARVAWASNVLGVTAQVGRLGVELDWQRPAGSSHVLVTRRRVRRGPSVVVYRGWATSYRDASARPCTGYRYTIVNYDRKGRRSTGVPTSVVTRCR